MNNIPNVKTEKEKRVLELSKLVTKARHAERQASSIALHLFTQLQELESELDQVING